MYGKAEHTGRSQRQQVAHGPTGQGTKAGSAPPHDPNQHLGGRAALLFGLRHLLVHAARAVPEIHQRGGDLMPHMVQDVQRPQAGFAGQLGRFVDQCKRPMAHSSYKPDQGVLSPEADLIQKVAQPGHLRAVMEPLAEPLTVGFQTLAQGAGLFFFQLQRRSPFPGFRAGTPAPRWAKAAAVPPSKPADGRCPSVDVCAVRPPCLCVQAAGRAKKPRIYYTPTPFAGKAAGEI